MSTTTPLSRRHVLRAGAALSGGVAVAGIPGFAHAAVATSKMARGTATQPADSVVDSFGMSGVHFNHLSTVYGDHDQVIYWLQQLGVRHVRSQVTTQREVLSAFERIAGLGMKVQGIVGTLTSDTPNAATLMQTVRDRFPDPSAVFTAFENINEPNNDGIPWVEDTRRKVRELYQARTDAGLSNIPLVAPALARVTSGGVEGPTTWEQAGNLGDLSPYVNYGNIHVYPRGGQPSVDINYFTGCAQRVSGSRRILCTEGGYFTAMDYVGGAFPVPEAVTAVYGPQALMEHLKAGARRFFRYELLDDQDTAGNREGTLGMIRTSTSPWTPKPDFAPMQKLLRLFADPGTSFSPAPVSYTLSGAPTDLRQMAFARRDGSHLIALWLDRPVYDARNRSYLVSSLTAPMATVRLSLPVARQVRVHRMVDLTSTTATRTADRKVDLPAGVTVLELR